MMLNADGSVLLHPTRVATSHSVLLHADSGDHKPLNCRFTLTRP